MKKIIALILFVFVVIGCKSKASIAEARAAEELSTRKIIESHYDSRNDFSSVYIRANTKYKDEKQSYTFTSEIRIQKDEKISVSIRFLGITMAKALITPTEVKYYEKNGNKYFEGDYSTLSKWLGTDLDFEKVQNLLLGKAMDDLRKGIYKNSIESKFYKLEETTSSATQKSFYFEAANFLIKKQRIEQPLQDRRLQVDYPQHKEYKEGILPLKIVIDALQGVEKTSIGLDYNSVTFNEKLSFPYSVPDGYERIYIN
ncbi:DUF4292 domain-containing protein [Flavobacterium orientale]|uniref:DUF4292 domain-containing protein n=1 Tax=Flavobacterium orientale TaxID=1756020 RepID=A0A916XYW7_9FLAO|nr:DUF4292 domain-containing protein [Flavobacterium orientale]GGD23057.1 hypothetical protein GCM10011343_11530 [Flavobacterium orientale]